MSSDEHVSRFESLSTRKQLDKKLPQSIRLTPAQLKGAGKVRKGGGKTNVDLSSYDDHQQLLKDIKLKFDKVWVDVVYKELGFRTLNDMRKQWHKELAERGQPLNITL
jgi:hypothetical protein